MDGWVRLNWGGGWRFRGSFEVGVDVGYLLFHCVVRYAKVKLLRRWTFHVYT